MPRLNRSNGSAVRLALLTILGLACASTAAEAGNGSFDAATNKFSMVVSVRWNATTAELGNICSEFQTASGILLDATDNGNQFGLLLVANNSTANDAADYYVLKADGRSSAPSGDFGVSGEHCTLYRGAAAPATRWEEVIVHETSHYVYCVRDEYEGPPGGGAGNAGGSCPEDCAGVGAVCIGNAASSACLMEGPDDNDSEFCWSGNHDPDTDTEHHCDHGESCWETIAATPYGLVLPAGAPVEAAPAADPIACIYLEGTPRVMLVLDRSGSMAGTRLADAKKAAKLVVDLVETGTYLGVVSFSGTTPGAPADAAINYVLQTIDGAADRAAAKAAIDALVAGGWTNYSSGLDKAYDEFDRVGMEAANKGVIFLSDGENNRPEPDPDGALDDSMDDLIADNIKVNTIGIGDELPVDAEDRLRDMADDSGGIYSRTPIGSTPLAASTLVDIKPNFARSWAKAVERGEIKSRARDLPIGQVVWDTVEVDPVTQQATFLTSWRPSSTVYLEYRLRDPSGNLIDPNMSGQPGIEYVEDPLSDYAFYRITPPRLIPGLWQVGFRLVQHNGPLPITWQVFARSRDIWPTCRTSLRRAFYGPGDADILVHAKAYCGGPLSPFQVANPESSWTAMSEPIGSTVEHKRGTFEMVGRLYNPDGVQIYQFPLTDDANPQHGDEMLGDGRFTGRIPSGLLSQYDEGSYTVSVTMVNDGGAYYAGAHANPDPAGGREVPIPDFTRVCYTSIVNWRESTSAPDVEPLGPRIFDEGRIVRSVPNPFGDGGTRIDYELAVAAPVRLKIFDVSGRLVRTLVQERLEAGAHEVFWDGRDQAGRIVAGGVYVAVLQSTGGATSHRLQFVR